MRSISPVMTLEDEGSALDIRPLSIAPAEPRSAAERNEMLALGIRRAHGPLDEAAPSPMSSAPIERRAMHADSVLNEAFDYPRPSSFARGIRFDGITIGDLSFGSGGAEFTLRADLAKVKPGRRSNLIVTVSGERVPPASQQPSPPRRRVVMGILPAIAFEVVTLR